MGNNNNLSKLIAVLTGFIYVYLNVAYHPANVLSWDVFGYYLYLPLTFIYHDLGMENVSVIQDIISQYGNTGTLYQASQMPAGNWVLKYSMGLSILYLPFFLLGHLFALSTDYAADGFSAPYQVAISIGSLVYTLLGIFLLRKLLLQFFNDKVSSVTLVLVIFGTNYFFHTAFHGQNAMSHNYLFTLYAVILLLTNKWHNTHHFKHMILLAVAIGITILSRPSEIVALFIPLLWGITNKETLLAKVHLLIKHKMQLVGFIATLAIIGSFQFIYWKVQTGKFIFDSYAGNPGEGFEFASPYTWQLLFSFRKGWLIYTPMMLLALVGFYFLYRKNRSLFYPILLFFLANLYIVSSWSCWWYAESFSQRSLVQSYLILAIPLGYCIQYTQSLQLKVRLLPYAAIALLLGLNLFQTWQSHAGILHGSRMTFNYYKAVFAQLEIPEGAQSKLLIDRAVEGPEIFTSESDYTRKELQRNEFEDRENKHVTEAQAFSGNTSFQLSEQQPYSPEIKARYSAITNSDHAWIRGSVMVYPTTKIADNPVSFVFSFEHKGQSYKYKALDLENLGLQPNQWNKVFFDYLTPEVRTKKDNLKVFVWLRGKEKMYIDDMIIEVFEPNN